MRSLCVSLSLSQYLCSVPQLLVISLANHTVLCCASYVTTTLVQLTMARHHIIIIIIIVTVIIICCASTFMHSVCLASMCVTSGYCAPTTTFWPNKKL